MAAKAPRNDHLFQVLKPQTNALKEDPAAGIDGCLGPDQFSMSISVRTMSS